VRHSLSRRSQTAICNRGRNRWLFTACKPVNEEGRFPHLLHHCSQFHPSALPHPMNNLGAMEARHTAHACFSPPSISRLRGRLGRRAGNIAAREAILSYSSLCSISTTRPTTTFFSRDSPASPWWPVNERRAGGIVFSMHITQAKYSMQGYKDPVSNWCN
jgi:hypothetical protein